MSEEEQIRGYIAQNLMFGEENTHLDPDASLLDMGIVDSVAVMELVLYVEEHFGLSVADDEIVPDNFDSIAKLASYVRSKRAMSDQ